MMMVRAMKASDFVVWRTLYAEYADFYGIAQTDEMRERVWTWLMDLQHEVKGFIAIDENGNAVGFAHYRPFSRPLSASTGGFLDDLYVTPSARGQEISKQLIARVAEEGRIKGWSVVRWITAENNYRARSTYDKIAGQTAWVTYDIKLN